MYAHDYEVKDHSQVSTNPAANWETWGLGDVFRRFQLFSNELSTPAVLLCPSDKERTGANSFVRLRNENISYTCCLYFFLLGETEKPFSSDRNIQMDAFFLGGPVHWTKGLHEYKGNILFHDGHVEKSDDKRLQEVMNNPRVRTSLRFPEDSPPVAGGSGGSASGGDSVSGRGAGGGGRSAPNGGRSGGGEGSSGFAALQNFFRSPGASQNTAPQSSSSTPTPATPAPPSLESPLLTENFAPTNPTVKASTNRAAPTLANTTFKRPPEDTSVPELAASGNVPPVVTEPAERSFNWLLLLLLVLVSAGLFGAMFERRRRHPRSRRAIEAD